MRYIRFLKTPKLHSEEGSNSVIKLVVTITSDLGDTFFPGDLLLAASLRSNEQNGDIYLRKTVKWEAGMRALPIELTFEQNHIDWPARVHVHARDSARSDHFERHSDGSDMSSVISAWSDILDPPQGVFEASKSAERRFTPMSNRTLSIWEETGESIARHLWDGGLALSAYLDRMVALQAEGIPLVEQTLSAATYKRLHVIELGSGCGIVGITLAQTIPDCNILLTDLPEAAEIAQRNIENVFPAMGSSVSFQSLNWEDPLPKKVQARTYDLIMLADCTYNSDSSPALVRTLSALQKKSPKAVILIAMKVRHPSEDVFFDLMRQAMFIEASHIKIQLPVVAEVGEKVEVYVFHGEDRPSYTNGTTPDTADAVVTFWQD
ncbi:S-adenosyl-L-methionine-dependent methyltransferase [Venturia nashicola]|uniref:S-adenosyl-L-methionine-dependent methyltransferase n=1 Tax=Venturia nashicola TaxID=86259 RepID=A0A4Z1PN61_9PEZI|nr:S-adenosyl-L-methionine-dependent methyltransferase [Venturia nashicola]TLD39224.1 S-adenosyl-L-methionine-dependent methyltransferase [Venturia nashicola]